MTTVLTVRDAEKRFDSTRALAGAGLELVRGEWLALLGPNGAGKTTLVRSIAGRVRLDGGEIRLLDTLLDGGETSRAARGRLGVVPQEVALYPLLSARENLTAFGELLGVRGAELKRRREWALDWTGLADRASEPVKRFSGGMKRRLNIACSVLHQPEVVLLDEPTVGVDPQSRERIWEMLEQLRQEGASLLLTTHQLDEAQKVCDRIVIIDHGRDVATGTFDQLVCDTVGTRRRVTVVFDGAPPAGLQDDAGWELRGRTLVAWIEDVAEELPGLLAQVKAAGGNRSDAGRHPEGVQTGRHPEGVQTGYIADVQIDAPSLQAVFIHLTGRELRE